MNHNQPWHVTNGEENGAENGACQMGVSNGRQMGMLVLGGGLTNGPNGCETRPLLVDWVILIRLLVREVLWRLDQVGVEDAVGGIPWGLGDRAERHRLLRREQV